MTFTFTFAITGTVPIEIEAGSIDDAYRLLKDSTYERDDLEILTEDLVEIVDEDSKQYPLPE